MSIFNLYKNGWFLLFLCFLVPVRTIKKMAVAHDHPVVKYQWPKESKKSSLPVYGDNEVEAESEIITCYLCDPPKLVPSNRFNVSRHSNLMFHLEFLHSGSFDDLRGNMQTL